MDVLYNAWLVPPSSHRLSHRHSNQATATGAAMFEVHTIHIHHCTHWLVIEAIHLVP